MQLNDVLCLGLIILFSLKIKVKCRDQTEIPGDEMNTVLTIFKRPTWNLQRNQMSNEVPATPNNGNYERYS